MDLSKILEKEVEYCDNCNGYGSSLKEEGNVCSKCGGSGIKSEK